MTQPGEATTASVSSVCGALAHSLSALFTCSPQGDMVRIRTPFLYPDGDVIDLYCRETAGGGMTVTDLGETTRWLRMQTAASRRSQRQDALIHDTAMNHGVEFFRGALQARHRQGEDFAAIVTRVSQAALRVSDLWFTFRTRSVASAAQEVAEFLDERRIEYAAAERLPGRSGRSWVIDFHTRTRERSALVTVLATGSRGAAHSVAERTLAAWYDLSHMKVGPEPVTLISLFDDTVDVWSESDFKLVEDLSEVARWSDPEGFEGFLRTAA
ncbi:MAG: DUF1828 domain-containing protein [Dehalococcoidia bacterium]